MLDLMFYSRSTILINIIILFPKVTTNAGLLTASREGLKQYENKMEQECGEKAKCVPPMDIKILHDDQKALTLKSFSEKKKMGTKKDAKPYYNNLSKVCTRTV